MLSDKILHFIWAVFAVCAVVCWNVQIAWSQETFGAEANPTGEPIGGGEGYSRIVTTWNYRVATKSELLEALKKATAGQTIFVDGAAEIDLSGERGIVIPGGVTLASDRGQKGSAGALLFTTQHGTTLFEAGGERVRVTGLRLRGPDPEVGKESYKPPTSTGIRAAHPRLEVDNCELSAWALAAVMLADGATKAHIHHNFIHHCQRTGLGYGVCLAKADALIEANLFDWCRHAIAATGVPGSGYEARYNVHLEHSTSHCFDAHGGFDSIKNGTDIACDFVLIHHNTFKFTRTPVVIRGRPAKEALIHHNRFLEHAYEESAVVQLNAMSNMRVYQNYYGKAKPDALQAQLLRDRLSDLYAGDSWTREDAAAAAGLMLELLAELMKINAPEREITSALNHFKVAYFEKVDGLWIWYGETAPSAAYERLLALLKELKPATEAQGKALESWMQTLVAEMQRRREQEAQAQVDRGTFQREWLILGPFRWEPRKFGPWPWGTAKSPDYKATYEATLHDATKRTLLWEHRSFTGEPGEGYCVGYVDLKKSLKPNIQTFAYAAGEVEVAQDTDVIFWIGSADEVTVWLDGKEIHRKWVVRSALPDEDRVPVHLTAGVHSVVLQIGQWGGEWGFYFRISNADGKGAPQGVTFRCPAR